MRWLRAFVRLLGIFCALLSYCAVLELGALALRCVGGDRIGWRNRVVRFWAHLICRLVGCRLVVRGTPPEPPFVLVCNHLSYVDIPVLFSVVDGVFIAKIEIRSWPLFGYVAASAQTIFVDRTLRRDVMRVNQEIADQMNDRQGLILFPEGGISDGRDVPPFKPSLLAFPAGRQLPVSYASLTYRTPAGEVGARRSVCWWETDVAFLVHLFRFLRLPSFEAVLTFGEAPVVGADRKVLARTLWERVRAQFEPLDDRDAPPMNSD